MPNLLSPTNHVPNIDNVATRGIPAPSREPGVPNVVDPGRVVRPDNRNDQQDAGDAASAMRYESNFLTFLQRLKSAGSLSDVFSMLLRGDGMQIASGITEGLAGELAQFLEFLQMDESQLLPFLQTQLKSSSRFGGALFQALWSAYQNAHSDVLREDILQFLRKFSDFSSTAHLESRMLQTLYDMSKSMPSRWADRLLLLGGQLENGIAAGDRAGNLKLLQTQIFDLLTDYVSQTHDHGRPRTLLSMLTLDLVRYANGEGAGVAQSLRMLSNAGVLPESFGALSDSNILQLLRQTDFYKASKNDFFADQLVSMARRALAGEGSANAQEIFRNLMASILVNESVYMPLRHVLLPVEWNGRHMFSEMWVDPDAEPEKREQKGRSQRILIKMDIQGLGAFDLLFHAQGMQATLQAACPAGVASFSETVSKDLAKILERNGLTPGEIRVSAMQRPMLISEAFPKLFEQVGAIDVKI